MVTGSCYIMVEEAMFEVSYQGTDVTEIYLIDAKKERLAEMGADFIAENKDVLTAGIRQASGDFA